MAAQFFTSVRIFSKLPFPNPNLPDSIPLPSTSLRFAKQVSSHKIAKPIASNLQSSSASSLQPLLELPPKLQDIVKIFQSVSDSKAKYEQLLFYGRNLKPMDSQFKTESNKVIGCRSQVWVRAYLDSDSNVAYEADSDSVFTKGLAALLVQGLSGRTVEEILRISPDFFELLGLQQTMTLSRNNGLLNMLRLMQKKAAEIGLENLRAQSEERQESPTIEVNEKPKQTDNDVNQIEPGSGFIYLGERGMRMKEILERELKPLKLEVEDVSYQHAGHSGVKGSVDGETHFNVKVVSSEFVGKSLVKRHRMVYSLLDEELQSGLHAISIVAKAPSEVEVS